MSFRNLIRYALPLSALTFGVGSGAHAAGLADLTTGIAFTDAIAAIMAVGLALVPFLVAKKGAKEVLSFIGK